MTQRIRLRHELDGIGCGFACELIDVLREHRILWIETVASEEVGARFLCVAEQFCLVGVLNKRGCVVADEDGAGCAVLLVAGIELAWLA